MVRRFYKKPIRKRTAIRNTYRKGYRKFRKVTPYNGAPPYMFANLRYVAREAYSGDHFRIRKFTINDAYKPDYDNALGAGTSHQPYLFDQYCASGSFFAEFAVTGVRYKITCYNKLTTHGVFVMAHPERNAGATAPDDVSQIEEQQWSKRAVATLNKPAVLTGYINIPRFLGIPKKNYLHEDSYIGTYAASPAYLVGLFIDFYATDESTNLDIEYTVELTYTTKFFSRVNVAQS